MDNTDDDSSELEEDDNTGLKPLVEVKEDVKGKLSELLAEEDMDNDSSALISSEKKDSCRWRTPCFIAVV